MERSPRGNDQMRPLDIARLDKKIDVYVENMIEEIFKGREGFATITDTDKDVAREVLRQVARFEIYHRMVVTRNPDQAIIGRLDGHARTTKLKILANREKNNAPFLQKLKGYTLAFARSIKVPKDLDARGIGVYAGLYARKLLRKVSFETYFRDLDSDDYLTNQMAEAIRHVLSNGGSVSESFDTNCGEFGHMKRDVSWLREWLQATEQFRMSGRNSLETPRRFFDFQGAYEAKTDRVLDFIAYGKLLGRARFSSDISGINKEISQILYDAVTPFEDISTEEFRDRLQKKLLECTEIIRVRTGRNEFDYEDCRRGVEKIYKAMRRKLKVKTITGFATVGEERAYKKMKALDEEMGVGIHVGPSTVDTISADNKIAIATGIVAGAAMIYYLFQVPGQAPIPAGATFGTIGGAALLAELSVGIKSLRSKFSKVKASGYFRKLPYEQQRSIDNMVTDNLIDVNAVGHEDLEVRRMVDRIIEDVLRRSREERSQENREGQSPESTEEQAPERRPVNLQAVRRNSGRGVKRE